MDREASNFNEVDPDDISLNDAIELLRRPDAKKVAVTNGGTLQLPADLVLVIRRQNQLEKKMRIHRERWERFQRRWLKVRALWELRSYPTSTIERMCRLANEYSTWEAVSAGIDVDARPAIARKSRPITSVEEEPNNLDWFKNLPDTLRMMLVEDYKQLMSVIFFSNRGYWASNPRKINSTRGI